MLMEVFNSTTVGIVMMPCTLCSEEIDSFLPSEVLRILRQPTVAVPPRSSTFHRSPWRKGLVERAMVDSPSCKNDRDKALVNEINIGLIES